MNGTGLRKLWPLLRHRFVAVPLALLLATLGWNIHVATHDDGIITGTVRDRDGKPIAGAEVVFFERDFVNYQEKQKARTDAEGRYRFENMQVHIGQLEARLPDGRRSDRLLLRLWFRAQNTQAAPLVVPGGKS